MKILIVIVVLLAGAGKAYAQGSDILPPPLPNPTFPTPGAPAPDPTGIVLPQVISPEKKAAAGAAADHYDSIAQGSDNFTGYWCSLSALICGYMAETGAVMRVYSAMNRNIQRDPPDPHFREPIDAVLPDAAALGLSYLPQSDPGAPYFNWLIGNTQSFFAWSEMVRVTADRAATCLLLSVDCSGWQLDRLAMGLEQMAYIENEMGGQIAIPIRDYLWSQGLGGEGWMYNDIAGTAIEAARELRGVSGKTSGNTGNEVDMR